MAIDPASLALIVKSAINLLDMAKNAGWEPSDDELNSIRGVTQKSVDEWNAMNEAEGV